MSNFIALEKSEKFVKELYPKLKSVDKVFKDQLKRSSLSIALNLAEGHAKSGADRRRFYKIAYGSARETMCAMRILEFDLSEIDQICAMLYRLRENAK